MRSYCSLTHEWWEWVLTIEAWCQMLRAAMLIRIPWRRQKLLNKALMDEGIQAHGRLSVGLALVNAASRARRFHLKEMSCLENSLALVWMLRRHGLSARLEIGCRREDQNIRFHAWVIGPSSTPLENSKILKAFTPLSFAS